MISKSSNPSRSVPLLKLRTTAVLRLREARAYLADRKGPQASQGKKNILIYGRGRSGTTLLEQLLISTGYFTGYHEALNTHHREVIFPISFVRGLGRLSPGKHIVIHVKPEHLGKERPKCGPVDVRTFLEAMVEDGWLLIHMQRKDILRQMMSKYVAQARGSYHKYDDAKEEIHFHFPERDFIADYERRLGIQAREKVLLNGLRHISLLYEEHLENPEVHQQTIDHLLNNLKLPSRPVSTNLYKITEGSPGRYLKNAEALQAQFANRGWEWTL